MVMHLPPNAAREAMPNTNQRFRNRWPIRLYKWFGRLGYPLWESHTHLYYVSSDALEITYFTRKLDDPHNWCWNCNGMLMQFNDGQIDDWTDRGIFDTFKASKSFANSFETCSDVDSFTSVMESLITHPGPGRWSVQFKPPHRCSPKARNLTLLIPQGGNFVWHFEDNSRLLMVKLSARVNPAY